MKFGILALCITLFTLFACDSPPTPPTRTPSMAPSKALAEQCAELTLAPDTPRGTLWRGDSPPHAKFRLSSNRGFVLTKLAVKINISKPVGGPQRFSLYRSGHWTAVWEAEAVAEWKDGATLVFYPQTSTAAYPRTSTLQNPVMGLDIGGDTDLLGPGTKLSFTVMELKVLYNHTDACAVSGVPLRSPDIYLN